MKKKRKIIFHRCKSPRRGDAQGGNRFLTMQNELQNLSSLSLNLKFKDPWRRKRIFTAEKSLIIKINSYIHIISLFFFHARRKKNIYPFCFILPRARNVNIYKFFPPPRRSSYFSPPTLKHYFRVRRAILIPRFILYDKTKKFDVFIEEL